MTLGAAEAATPAVGIFWGVGGGGRPATLLADLVPLDQAEPYGDFLTHGGHYDHWLSLERLGAGVLRQRGLPTAPTWSEYEEWPRGRVVYLVPGQRFTVYADRQLQQAPWLALIAGRFGLSEGSFDLRGDPHYVSLRRL
ncbi:hypothetical protein [Teichococcus oryzae]|uniref:Uncharacterized protein n=1 Tax=Teichococcus oryzae TaxID=1608942 RepID=A0A5B2TAY5_9PROT|nr:hypothetical protein [Pseudoroseomonas oryzae]KAA2211359.1 hypothetical protein F0Q34_20460 [Pseudoroseomonas oryzae]